MDVRAPRAGETFAARDLPGRQAAGFSSQELTGTLDVAEA